MKKLIIAASFIFCGLTAAATVDDQAQQGVLALSETDAKICEERGACMLVTPAVLEELMKHAHACDDLKGRKRT